MRNICVIVWERAGGIEKELDNTLPCLLFALRDHVVQIDMQINARILYDVYTHQKMSSKKTLIICIVYAKIL